MMIIFLYIFSIHVALTFLSILFSRWSNAAGYPEAIPLGICFFPVANWFVWMVAILNLIDLYMLKYLADFIESKFCQDFLKWFYAKDK